MRHPCEKCQKEAEKLAEGLDQIGVEVIFPKASRAS